MIWKDEKWDDNSVRAPEVLLLGVEEEWLLLLLLV